MKNFPVTQSDTSLFEWIYYGIHVKTGWTVILIGCFIHWSLFNGYKELPLDQIKLSAVVIALFSIGLVLVKMCQHLFPSLVIDCWTSSLIVLSYT